MQVVYSLKCVFVVWGYYRIGCGPQVNVGGVSAVKDLDLGRKERGVHSVILREQRGIAASELFHCEMLFVDRSIDYVGENGRVEVNSPITEVLSLAFQNG